MNEQVVLDLQAQLTVQKPSTSARSTRTITRTRTLTTTLPLERAEEFWLSLPDTTYNVLAQLPTTALREMPPITTQPQEPSDPEYGTANGALFGVAICVIVIGMLLVGIVLYRYAGRPWNEQPIELDTLPAGNPEAPSRTDLPAYQAVVTEPKVPREARGVGARAHEAEGNTAAEGPQLLSCEEFIQQSEHPEHGAERTGRNSAAEEGQLMSAYEFLQMSERSQHGAEETGGHSVAGQAQLQSPEHTTRASAPRWPG